MILPLVERFGKKAETWGGVKYNWRQWSPRATAREVEVRLHDDLRSIKEK